MKYLVAFFIFIASFSASYGEIIAAVDKVEELESRALAAGEDTLEEDIKERYEADMIDINVYSYATPENYKIGLLVDPCRNRNVDCCIDHFGNPAYMQEDARSLIPVMDEAGVTLDASISRVGDRPIVFDSNCYVDAESHPYRLQKRLTPKGLQVTHKYNDSTCVGRLKALLPLKDVVRPACWDHNVSVNALASCYGVDGRKKQTCVAIGYTQTAYISQCFGEFALDNHCGTFLELHEPGSEVILSQTRLLGEFTSGFRTTTLPLFFQGDKGRTVCSGAYEIWWVLRTKYNFIVYQRKSFRVTHPTCDFDLATNTYKNFYTMDSRAT